MDTAAAAGVAIEVRTFREGTRTAADAAAAIGCPLGAIVKSIVLDSDAGPLVVLTSGVNRVDYAKVASVAGVGAVVRADADAARTATGYPIGGTAPFIAVSPPPVLLCDEDLLRYEEVWAAAGTPDTVFPIDPHALVRATGAQVADVAE